MGLKSSLYATLFKFKQRVRAANRRRLRRRHDRCLIGYSDWLKAFDAPPSQWLTRMDLNWHGLDPALTFTLVMNIGEEAEPQAWQASVESVLAQAYPHWMLHILGGDPDEVATWLAQSHPAENRIRIIGNQALEPVWTHAIPLRGGDQLATHALAVLWDELRRRGDVDVLYSDVDVMGSQGQRHSPEFKPDWDPDLCLTKGYVNGLVMFLRWDASQNEHEMMLRQLVQEPPGQVVHIPRILVHRADRDTGQEETERLRAVQALLGRIAPQAVATAIHASGIRISWPLPSPPPLVSIVIPTKNQVGLLRKCIESLMQKTVYPAKQIIVVDNGTDNAEALAYLQEVRHYPGVVVKIDRGPFNYSALNNSAIAELARGEFLVLMNNDVEAIHGDWLVEMVSQAARPGIGCVGARLLYSDETIQHGGVILGIGNNDGVRGVAAHAHKALTTDDPGYAGRAQVAQRFCAVTAACLVVRRSTFDLVGGLNEQQLAVAYNDVDFCLRVREAGFANVWTPHATLYHHESVSRGKDTSSKNLNRFLKEAEYMRQRWGTLLDNDPAYNPNLTQDRASFQLAWPPRVPHLDGQGA